MSITLDISAKFNTTLHKKEYEKNLKLAQAGSLISHMLFGSKTEPTKNFEHPLHKKSFEVFKNIANNLPTNKGLTINFGDSLTDLSRKYLSDEIDGIFSISGSWSNHMAQMAREIRPYLVGKVVDYVTVGTLGGNPLLIYEEFNHVVDEAYKALNEIRTLYSGQKMIVYGLPPVFNINATLKSYDFCIKMLEWCVKNGAVYVDLHKQMGSGFLNLFPTVQWSSDGVHFTPSGARKFAKLINRAKNSIVPLIQ